VEWVVEVFTLKGHPKAQRVFAWTFKEEGKTKTTAVLESPVDGRQTAVKVAIATKARGVGR